MEGVKELVHQAHSLPPESNFYRRQEISRKKIQDMHELLYIAKNMVAIPPPKPL